MVFHRFVSCCAALSFSSGTESIPGIAHSVVGRYFYSGPSSAVSVLYQTALYFLKSSILCGPYCKIHTLTFKIYYEFDFLLGLSSKELQGIYL